MFKLCLFIFVLSAGSFSFANDQVKMVIEDDHPQAWFCTGLPVDQSSKYTQYVNQMKQARRLHRECKRRNNSAWNQEYRRQLRILEQAGQYKSSHWHDNDWSNKNFSNSQLQRARDFAKHQADKKLCPFFIKPVEDPIIDTIDTITGLNDWFKSDSEATRFADNLGNEIFDWLVYRSMDPGAKIELNSNGRLIGDEFKGDIGFFGSVGLFFSDGKSKPERVLHYLAQYVESGPMEDREFKLAKIKILLDVFEEIFKKDSPGFSDLGGLSSANPQQVQKYRVLTRDMFRAFLGQSSRNRAIQLLSSSTHETASHVIKDFLQIKMDDLGINAEDDQESIIGAVSYVLGETNQNTTPPITNREFEFFDRSTFFGAHLKGNVKDCLECALNMSAMVMCYQRGYANLQEPLISWTLRKFEFNTSGDENSSLSVGGSDNVTQIDTSLGTVGERFEQYLQTGDFFQSFLQPTSTNLQDGPPSNQASAINLLNDTKLIFEDSFTNLPTDYFSFDNEATNQNIQQDPVAMNWIGFRDDWAKRYKDRETELRLELRSEYYQYSQLLTPQVPFEEALRLRLQSDPYIDKLKLHYAMESTLRFMTKSSIDTLLKQLNLTEENIANMEEPLKSRAIETRRVILDKKLDIFSRTIPRMVRSRLDDLLSDPEMKDLPLFEYAIENLRQQSVEDGFSIINELMNDKNIQAMVDQVSLFKYTEITQNFGIDPNDEIGQGLHQLIIGSEERPSLSNRIFLEVRDFFHDVHAEKEAKGISITDDEMTLIFDARIVKLNDDLLNYTFTGENKALFKDLVFNLYDKYMQKILALDPDYASNPELQAIKRQIDEFVRNKSDDIINRLKLLSHGRSPLKVIESIEENLVGVLNQDVFGNEQAKDLLKSLTNEIMAVQIQKYAGFVFNDKDTETLHNFIENRGPDQSKMDAAFQGLVNVFYSNYGSNDANIAEVILTLKNHVDTTFDTFFEEGNQQTIGELVVDLQDNITRELSTYLINNEDLLKDTIQSQAQSWRENINRFTIDADQPLRDAITRFDSHLDNTITGDAALRLFTDRIRQFTTGENLKVQDLIKEGADFTNEQFWSKDESRTKLKDIAKELIQAEKRRVFSLLSKTYDNFDPAKKSELMQRYESLFAKQENVLNEMIDNVFEHAQNGEYIQLYQETLATTIEVMNDNILNDSEFRNLLEIVLKDSVTNSIKNVNTSTLLPDSTKRELERIGHILVNDVDTIFNREVEKEFENISDVITFVDDIAHYSINEVIVTQSKSKDLASLFASTVYDTRGLESFMGKIDTGSSTIITPEWSNERFPIPHPQRFNTAAQLMLNNLSLQEIVPTESELRELASQNDEFETLSDYIKRLQDANFSIVSPLIGEIAEMIRFQSFCPQFDPTPEECIKDPSKEIDQGIYNTKFLQALSFLRLAASSPQENCRVNTSNALKKANLMRLAELASENNKSEQEYWNINLWLSELIKDNKDITPSIVECALTKTLANVEDILEEQNENIEHFAGTQTQQALSEILTPEMLITLREQNPNIYKEAYEELSQFFLNPNGNGEGPSNISSVISDHVNHVIVPQIVDTPDFQKKSLLLLSNTNTNTLIDSAPGPHWNWLLTGAAWFSSIDRDWITTLQGDISAEITEQEMNDIFRFMPRCADEIAQKYLAPIKLNAQGMLKDLLDPNSSVESIEDRSENFCFRKIDGTMYCIPVMEDNLDELDEAQRLELLIRRTQELLNVVNEEYSTSEYEQVYENGQWTTRCKRVINSHGWLGFGGDSLTSQEKPLIDRYMVTLRGYLQDMLQLKFLLRGIKHALPDLKAGRRDRAANKLVKYFEDRSRPAEWVGSGYGGYYGPGGYMKPEGEFHKLLEKDKLNALGEQFRSIADCMRSAQ